MRLLDRKAFATLFSTVGARKLIFLLLLLVPALLANTEQKSRACLSSTKTINWNSCLAKPSSNPIQWHLVVGEWRRNSDKVTSSHPRELDVVPGGDIMIHGITNGFGWIGSKHRAFDWTDGCIAVTDEEVEEIWKLVPDGT